MQNSEMNKSSIIVRYFIVQFFYDCFGLSYKSQTSRKERRCFFECELNYIKLAGRRLHNNNSKGNKTNREIFSKNIQ